MKASIRPLVVAGIALTLSLSPSCANDNNPKSGDEIVGSVGLQLQIAPGVTINTVSWSITNATTGFNQSGSVNEQFSNTISFQVGGLPAAHRIHDQPERDVGRRQLQLRRVGDVRRHRGRRRSTSASRWPAPPPAATRGRSWSTAPTQICANIDLAVGRAAGDHRQQPDRARGDGVGGFDHADVRLDRVGGHVRQRGQRHADLHLPADAGHGDHHGQPSRPSALGAARRRPSRSVTVTCDTLNPTFTNVYANIIGVRCTGCHRPGGSGVNVGMLDLSTPATAYASLVDVNAAGTGAGTSGVTCASLRRRSRAWPRQLAPAACCSTKVNSKRTGTLPACGSPMPLPATGAPLTQAQVDPDRRLDRRGRAEQLSHPAGRECFRARPPASALP